MSRECIRDFNGMDRADSYNILHSLHIINLELGLLLCNRDLPVDVITWHGTIQLCESVNAFAHSTCVRRRDVRRRMGAHSHGGGIDLRWIKDKSLSLYQRNVSVIFNVILSDMHPDTFTVHKHIHTHERARAHTHRYIHTHMHTRTHTTIIDFINIKWSKPWYNLYSLWYTWFQLRCITDIV
jgi:hypothetical protein